MNSEEIHLLQTRSSSTYHGIPQNSGVKYFAGIAVYYKCFEIAAGTRSWTNENSKFDEYVNSKYSLTE